jgi:hypothetical protein
MDEVVELPPGQQGIGRAVLGGGPKNPSGCRAAAGQKREKNHHYFYPQPGLSYELDQDIDINA